MTIRDLALQGMESAINALLALDPASAARLAALHGRVIAIALRGTGLVFRFIPDARGGLQLQGSSEAPPDCIISGSPLDLMRAADRERGSRQLFAGHVSIEGDSELGHRFSEILGGLDIDWEEQLARLIGDVAAHEVGRGVRGGGEYARQAGRTLEENLSEYLTEEARLLPHRYEVEGFLDATDQLRDAVERLAARIGLLEESGKRD